MHVIALNNYLPFNAGTPQVVPQLVSSACASNPSAAAQPAVLLTPFRAARGAVHVVCAAHCRGEPRVDAVAGGHVPRALLPHLLLSLQGDGVLPRRVRATLPQLRRRPGHQRPRALVRANAPHVPVPGAGAAERVRARPGGPCGLR